MASPSSNRRLTFTLLIAAGFVVLIWMIFQYIKSNYDDYRLKTYIESFQERNQRLAQEIESQYTDYLYYTSSAYYEKYAKGNLGLTLPGEKVIVITEPPEQTSSEPESFSSEREKFHALPNQDKWYLYFFGDPATVSRLSN